MGLGYREREVGDDVGDGGELCRSCELTRVELRVHTPPHSLPPEWRLLVACESVGRWMGGRGGRISEEERDMVRGYRNVIDSLDCAEQVRVHHIFP